VLLRELNMNRPAMPPGERLEFVSDREPGKLGLNPMTLVKLRHREVVFQEAPPGAGLSPPAGLLDLTQLDIGPGQ
jgi:hypothetical protein